MRFTINSHSERPHFCSTSQVTLDILSGCCKKQTLGWPLRRIRPALLPTPVHKIGSDLVFNHELLPFAFWITRRSEPGPQPLLDTRISSLLPTPITPVISADNPTALDGFPLTSTYKLREVVAISGFRRDIGTDSRVRTILTMWARDIAADPIEQNLWKHGSHSSTSITTRNDTSSTANSLTA
ncbi:uncharacterized protein PHACADRAFT_189426 [Phanerochaete carnosa HHB-10118-sp]|uniref:Uncharacterized protein n=1 Tax=Phanerochaete carnosa (strain HHB-10118-sp) TaxID=650164 RepID=K5VBM3_PHACS|nr:uncharacterized protein PHACADRAFT_189426 [Phanerochaete carnosa HHB-10118-sp]EKM60291.1 hypothetical protein PHACADRAFT_189426 [Phanerochaete carnosa HHB-10118-sp]